MELKIEEALKEKLPDLLLGGIIAHVKVSESPSDFQVRMAKEIEDLEKAYSPESIREMQTVKNNKDAYRRLGKDPNRYRPAAESLMRRVASGKGLYQINNVVDALNVISVKTGFSICGYDLDKVEGRVSMGIGKCGEPYEGIGRGDLNIENLPVFRDEKGGFGTPTSDSVRTMVTNETSMFLMLIIGFGNEEEINLALDNYRDLLEKYSIGTEKERFFIH